MNLGIIVDSSCSLSKKEIEAKGWTFLPLYLNMDGKEYIDGVDITPKEFYKSITPGQKVRSSATPPGLISEALEAASKKYDGVLVYALSAGLSSQTTNIKTLSRELKNVRVVDSWGMGESIVTTCEDTLEYAKEESSMDKILDFANKSSHSVSGFLVPKYMDWLVAGGRISPAAARMAGMLKIVPVIGFIEGNLTKFGKGRTFEKTIIKSAKQLLDFKQEGNNHFKVMHSGNEDVERIRDILLEIDGIDEAEISYFPPVVGVHTGSGGFALMSMHKEYNTKKS